MADTATTGTAAAAQTNEPLIRVEGLRKSFGSLEVLKGIDLAVNTGEVIAANLWGKAKTVSQMVAIFGILLMQYWQELTELGYIPGFAIAQFSNSTIFWFVGNVLVGICTLFTVISGAVYLKQNWHLFQNSK